MITYWRVGLVVALLMTGLASADEQQPSGTATGPTLSTSQASQPPAPLAASQAVAAVERPARFSFDVASRSVCFDFTSSGCTAGLQLGFGMKYGAIHAGVLFGGYAHCDYCGSSLDVRPFLGAEVGTRYYALAHRPSFTFSMAGRATIELVIGLVLHDDTGTLVAFMNTFGPNLRFDFGKRFGVFFRPGIGYFAGGIRYADQSENTSGISFMTDLQLGVAIGL
jgi:hypothetical protein